MVSDTFCIYNITVKKSKGQTIDTGNIGHTRHGRGQTNKNMLF